MVQFGENGRPTAILLLFRLSASAETGDPPANSVVASAHPGTYTYWYSPAREGRKGFVRVMWVRLARVTLAWVLVLAVPWGAFAAAAAPGALSHPAPAAAWFGDGAVPVSDEELESVSGDAVRIAVSAAIGAVSSAVAYVASSGDTSVGGIAAAAATGAVVGAVSGAFRTVKVVAEAGKTAIKAADVVYDAFVGLVEGALEGALSHLRP